MSELDQLPGSTFAGDSSIGTVAFANPQNAQLSDDVRAIATLLNGEVSQYLTVTGFGSWVPLDAVVTNVLVIIERMSSIEASIQDNSIKLIKGGVIQGNNLARTMWSSLEQQELYGSDIGQGSSPIDAWGIDLTPADVNAPDFGVAIAVEAIADATAQIDQVTITIAYDGSNRIGGSMPVRVGNGMSRSDETWR